MKTIAIVLDPLGHHSQVMVDGFTIPGVRGVEVRAWVGEVASVTLHLIGHVELVASLDEVTYSHQGGVSPSQDSARGKKGDQDPGDS